MAILLLYVDDMVLTASSDQLLRTLISRLQNEFAVKDMGDLSFFLGIDVQRSPRGFFLSQAKYAEEILERAGMANCNPITTPIDTKPKLSATEGANLANPSLYRSLVGALQYLTVTRPDLSYAVQQICLHMHDPRDAHMSLINRILRYMYVAHPSSAFIFMLRARWVSSPTQTPTGPVALTQDGPRLASVSSSATLSYHAPPSDNRRYLVLVPKPNTELLRMQFPSAAGCGTYLVSWVFLHARRPSLTVTMCQLSTWLQIQCITRERSTLSSIHILSERKLPLARYVLFMSQRISSLRM
jgi:hypothetical protein